MSFCFFLCVVTNESYFSIPLYLLSLNDYSKMIAFSCFALFLDESHDAKSSSTGSPRDPKAKVSQRPSPRGKNIYKKIQKIFRCFHIHMNECSFQYKNLFTCIFN